MAAEVNNAINVLRLSFMTFLLALPSCHWWCAAGTVTFAAGSNLSNIAKISTTLYASPLVILTSDLATASSTGVVTGRKAGALYSSRFDMAASGPSVGR